MIEIEEDFPTALEIKKEIANTKLAIKHTKKTVRLHQNKKKLVGLEKKLQIKIYQHNKFKIFDFICEKLDGELEGKDWGYYDNINVSYDNI
ncbi:hypothetical protein AB3N02_21680 [Priestia aryabhattai]|uniref:hypothetical protein n=1 Tax=Priestia aryabhattai TaxID=412384 RepID=UPI0039A24B1C